MTHSYFIRKTLGIKDKNIHFEEQVTEERINDQNHLVLYGKLTYTPKACEKCGTVNRSSADIVKNGTKLSTLKLTHINFKPVLLKLKKQRFLCKHCRSTFVARTKLKKQWKLLLKNESDLDYHRFFTHRLYEGMVSEYVMMEYLLSISPRLDKAYRIVSRLKWALANRRFGYFQTTLKDAKKETYPDKIRTALNTLEKYIEPIKNAFLCTLSNGPVEGINNKIKNIKRSGYGYHSFINLKNRILISFSLLNPGRKPKPLFYTKRAAKKPSRSLTLKLGKLTTPPLTV